MHKNQPATPVTKQLKALLVFDKNQNNQQLLPQLKEFLSVSSDYLESEFKADTNIRDLVNARARHIDKLLLALWGHIVIAQDSAQNELSLIAVGGYGRGELHPCSDIDLLILSTAELTEKQQASVQQFISLLWDCHLIIGQSVRNIDECVSLARDDLSIVTSLMESRLLKGSKGLYDQLMQRTAPKNIWDAGTFFTAKLQEQKARYKRFDGSSFDLEPNIKSSPGGLRDIQLLSWVAQRIYYPQTLLQLFDKNVITKKEFAVLHKAQLYLWRIRFALHLASGKAEDRLLFDFQKRTAEIMGFKCSKNSMAVEKMMKRYYRSVLIIRNMADILMQLLEQQAIPDQDKKQITRIDDDFQIVNHRVDAINPRCFAERPSLLLKVFQHVANDKNSLGITAPTLRAIRAARYKITSSFRNKKNNKALFVEFWNILHTSARAMFLMKRSGVLKDYLEAFKQITGQMQYDMFHSYTVDEHTLFLLQNLCDFANPEFNSAFPLCSEIMQRQAHPEIIFLAGLFHDIAKGRGGGHSQLGAIEAREFCINHDIDPLHALTIEWLVGNHLLMSQTAQKRDTSDPKVIDAFAHSVGSQQRLELLYILTVADIRATSNTLWNSWKDSLLRELFMHTTTCLQQDQTDFEKLWKSNRKQAEILLLESGFKQKNIEALWQYLGRKYYSKRTPEAIAWQTSKILMAGKENSPVVGIKINPHRSGSEVFVYSKDKKNLFATLTATLNQKGLSIQAANIYTDKNGYCYDSFYVLDEQGKPLKDKQVKKNVKAAIIENINNIRQFKRIVQRRMPRQFKYFSIKTQVEFFADEFSGYTRMELTTRDQPGLLAVVGEAFKICKTKLHDARISTLGEKVEDTFVISHQDNLPIKDKQEREKIRAAIIEQLDE